MQHDPYLVRPWDSKDPRQYIYQAKDLYRANCNFCHTTFPLADMLVRFHDVMTVLRPRSGWISRSPITCRWHGQSCGQRANTRKSWCRTELFDMLQQYRTLDARDHAVTLGISCEACHLGARQHAEGKWKKPLFFPKGPELAVITRKDESGKPSRLRLRTHAREYQLGVRSLPYGQTPAVCRRHGHLELDRIRRRHTRVVLFATDVYRMPQPARNAGRRLDGNPCGRTPRTV